MVYTNHDPKLHANGNLRENLGARVGSFLHDYLIKYDKIIVHGKSLKEILIQRGFSENRIRVVPHGSYSLFQKLGARKKVIPESNTILFFGHIRKYKGLEYLIRAASLVSKELPDLKIIIAGEGDLSPYSRLMTDKSRFEVHNRPIPDEMVRELFDRSQLLVLPYNEATQSGPLHIAYALGKPVIATKVGALIEAVRHAETGLLVPPKNERALAEAIVALLKDDELRRKMSENAYRLAMKELSWDTIARNTIEVYKEAMSTRAVKNAMQIHRLVDLAI
jgi:glycosyltransferase involved in cell wall biosynthesis